MPLKLTVLGSNAAMPAHGRITSSQILSNQNNLYLNDCGEGTQIRLSQYKIKRNNIKAIFISHLHGDHIYGLPGVLSSYFHFQRSQLLHIFGPPGIKKMIQMLMEIANASLGFELIITEISPAGKEEIYKDNLIQVCAFPMKHRIQTNGYLFEELKKPRNIRKDAIIKYNLSIPEIKSFKLGENVVRSSGEIIKAEDVLVSIAQPKSYAYCSDTIYDPSLAKYIDSVDLLYHETTYLHELQEKAAARMHSTAKEAAEIAIMCKAKKLMIGHYSGMYRLPDRLLSEAKLVFHNTIAGYDGVMVDI